MLGLFSSVSVGGSQLLQEEVPRESEGDVNTREGIGQRSKPPIDEKHMSDDNASFRINLKYGEIAFSGSEDFVASQIEEHRDVLDSLLSHLEESSPSYTRAGVQPDSPNAEEDPAGPQFPNVFDASEDDVFIIADIPGSSDKEKTVNLTHLFLFAKELLRDEKRVAFDEIREACKRHNCYNSSNFASYVKAAKIIHHGSGQSLSAELTFPGRKAAKELAEELNSGS